MHQSARSVAGFWILAAMLLVSVASSAVPSPIYPVYAAEWHLTPLMLTGVFAIYVAGLLASLLVAGRLSDHVGRKPVLVVGGLGVALSLGLFAMVWHWNSWFDGLLYLSNKEDYPLATYLQTVIVSRDMSSMSFSKEEFDLLSQKTINAAQIFIGALPVLIVYPFLQRFFIKGLVLGSVKE